MNHLKRSILLLACGICLASSTPAAFAMSDRPSRGDVVRAKELMYAQIGIYRSRLASIDKAFKRTMLHPASKERDALINQFTQAQKLLTRELATIQALHARFKKDPAGAATDDSIFVANLTLVIPPFTTSLEELAKRHKNR